MILPPSHKASPQPFPHACRIARFQRGLSGNQGNSERNLAASVWDCFVILPPSHKAFPGLHPHGQVPAGGHGGRGGAPGQRAARPPRRRRRHRRGGLSTPGRDPSEAGCAGTDKGFGADRLTGWFETTEQGEGVRIAGSWLWSWPTR